MQCCRLALGRETTTRPSENPRAIPDWCHLDAGSRLNRVSLELDAAFWLQTSTRRNHCLLDVSKIRSVDATGVAFLIRWRKQLATHGCQLVLLAPSVALRRTLATIKLADHFVTARDVADALQQTGSPTNHPPVQFGGTTRSLAWCGEIVAANVEDVWRMTIDHVGAFAANRATLVIIDLTRLRFIDSSGAALMLRLKKWAQQLHTEILFAHPHPNVRNVLRLTRIDHLLLEGGQ